MRNYYSAHHLPYIVPGVLLIVFACYVLFVVIMKKKPAGIIVTLGRVSAACWFLGTGLWFVLIYYDIFHKFQNIFFFSVQSFIVIVAILVFVIKKFKLK